MIAQVGLANSSLHLQVPPNLPTAHVPRRSSPRFLGPKSPSGSLSALQAQISDQQAVLAADRLDPGVPLATSLHILDIPPTVRLPAVVRHLLAKEEGLLSDSVSEGLGLPKEFVLGLIRFGAIHWCPVPPQPPDGNGVLQLQGLSPAFFARQAALSVFGQYPSYQKPRRTTEDTLVNQHAYIRVHCHPRRAPAFYSTDWQSRVVHDDAEYVVISKPPGVPVAPTVDNLLECTLTGAAQAIGFTGSMLITHRLDRCTEGLTVIGKTPEFVRRFNNLIQGHKGAVHKFYRTLTAKPPPLGPMVHHVTLNAKEPGLPPHTHVHGAPVEGSLRCELEVLQVTRLAAQDLPAALQPYFHEQAWEAELALRTGRTHQIRAQFAACGCPIFGDIMYAAIAQHAAGERPPPQVPVSSNDRLMSEPKSAIGLHAHRLKVEPRSPKDADLLKTFEAGPPWWQCDAFSARLVADWSLPAPPLWLQQHPDDVPRQIGRT